MQLLFKLCCLIIAFACVSVPCFANSNHLRRLYAIETNSGTIVVELLCDAAPITCENFMKLSESGFYDGLTFHRVVSNFMIQGGDPMGNGMGGTSIWGGPFADEFSPRLLFDRAGLLAMANCGPNTNTSQFFITVSPAPWLNNKHTIFGRVVRGYEVVEAISQVEVGANHRPLNIQQIIKIHPAR